MTEYERGRQDGAREEGERVLARIRETIASWECEPDLELRNWARELQAEWGVKR